MPSTAWNVFVASGVAVVVYLGVRMGRVLPALVAGTMLFIGGWMTGYAINRGAPIGIPRMLIAGGICGFVIVWTLVIQQDDYVIGGVVIGLVSFAAWFTSEMGPIKGETRPTAPIDEPRPPEGPRPGTPVDLGGGSESNEENAGNARSAGDGLFVGLREMLSPSAADAPEPPESNAPGAAGPSEEELRDHAASDDDGPTYTTRRSEPDERSGGEKESIFGLGIFYEGDPAGRSAGAVSDQSSNTAPKDGDHTRPAGTEASSGAEANADTAPARAEPDPDEGESVFGLGIFREEPPDEQRSADGATGATAEGTEAGDGRGKGRTNADAEPVRVEVDSEDEPASTPDSSGSGDEADPTPTDGTAPAEEPEPAEASPIRRLREPLNSPRRPGKSPEVESVAPNDGSVNGDGGAESSDAAGEPAAAERVDDSAREPESAEEESADDEPPEEHRVEIEDHGGFQFG